MTNKSPIFESAGTDNSFFAYDLLLENNLRLYVAGGTRKAAWKTNEPNEDSYVAAGSVLGICDGITNNKDGDVASGVTATVLALYALRNSAFQGSERLRFFEQLRMNPRLDKNKVDGLVPDMNRLVEVINLGADIRQACIHPSWSARSLIKQVGYMDTTVMVCEFERGVFRWYHQGDSCLYYSNSISGENGKVLTRPDWAVNHGLKGNPGALVYTIGDPNETRIVQTQHYKAGDTLVLFSDGVNVDTGNALLPLIPGFCQQAARPLLGVIDAAYTLLDEGWKNSSDDTTAIVARVEKI